MSNVDEILDLLQLKYMIAKKHVEVIDTFLALHTDEERVRFVTNSLLEHNMIPVKQIVVKDAVEADRLREQGNKMFLRATNGTQCVEALKLYTKSAANAPYPSKQLALAYANRSAVLLKMRKYTECLQDIDEALKLDYPHDLKAKLLVRRIECLTLLGKSVQGEMYDEALHWLERMSSNDSRKKLKTKLDSLCNAANTVLPVEEEDELDTPLPVIESQNPEVPCASSAIAIRYNDQFGRHIVATRRIECGEVIAIERPYSVILHNDNMQTHCFYCLNVCLANRPCRYCTFAVYCSDECRAMDWKMFHEIECPLHSILTNMNFQIIELLSVRVVIKAIREANSIQDLREEVNNVERNSDERTKGFASDGKFYSDKYRSIYSLVTNTEKRKTDLFRRAAESFIFLYYLATETSLFGSKVEKDVEAFLKTEDAIFVGGLIMRQLQITPSNVHSYTEAYGAENMKGSLEWAERGAAMMAFLSLFNHSCVPNILRQSKTNHIILHAIYPIEKDEQVLDNYGELAASTPKVVRQQALQKQYYFKCECKACIEDWPLYNHQKSFTSVSLSPAIMQKIVSTMEKVDKCFEIVKSGKLRNKQYVKKDLIKMISVFHKYVSLPCRELNVITETFKHIFALEGNKFLIPEI